MRAEVTNFFEGVKAKKHPPPEEKVDPVKAKRTLAALTKPPKSDPPKGNYDRIIGNEFAEAERSGSTVSDQRLKERRAGKKLPSSANKRTNRAPRSRCQKTSSLMIRGWCPVIAILQITCSTKYIMNPWRCRYKDTSTGSLSSKMKDLYQP